MRVRTVLAGVLVAAAVVPLAAHAVLYKWVDEQGVVNYGDTPPANAKKATKLDEKSSSLSVVPGMSKEEIADFRERLAQGRIDRLEREVEELRAREMAPPSAPAAYDTQVVYGGGYWPAYYRNFRRPLPPHATHLPVHGAPVHKTPPFRGMKLDR